MEDDTGGGGIPGWLAGRCHLGSAADASFGWGFYAADMVRQNTRSGWCCLRAAGPSLHRWMSAIRPSLNKARPANPAMTCLFHAGRQLRGVADAHR